MPTYDYRCDACGHEFDAFQSMKEDPLKACPECGEPQLRRLIGTGAGIIFKGSGFYETDYKRPRAGTGGDGGDSKGKTSESGGEPKKESKPPEKKSD